MPADPNPALRYFHGFYHKEQRPSWLLSGFAPESLLFLLNVAPVFGPQLFASLFFSLVSS